MLLAALAAGILLASPQEPRGERPLGAGPIHLVDGKTVKVKDFAIQLRSPDLAKLRASATDLLVVDPYEGKTRLSGSQVASLRTGPRGRRIVLAYVPVADINPRSPLWQKKWDADADGKPDDGAPEWLGPRDAEGDYPVKYWNADWQKTLYAGKATILSALVKAGFDGMLMDPGEALETKELQSFRAAQEMAKLMVLMARQGRLAKQRFLALCMNPEELMEFGGVMLSLDGVLVEGVYYGNEVESKPSSEEFLKDYRELKDLSEEGRLVLTVAYTTDPVQIVDNERRTRANGFVPFASPRSRDGRLMNH